MRIPAEQEIRVKMNILESFKIFYIQYVAFFVLLLWIVRNNMLDWAFSQNVLQSATSSELASLLRKR
jgi:hypothetical protein